MSVDTSFDYYSSCETPVDCAKWIAFIRCFCYVRTPACIYSIINTATSHRVFRTTKVVAVPDYISNILVDLYKLIDAREASIAGSEAELSVSLKDLFIEKGVLPYRDRVVSSTFKPRGVEPYGIMKQTVVRLDEGLVRLCARAVGSSESVMRRALVMAVTQVGRGVVDPSPLWYDEAVWVNRSGGFWERGVVYDEGY